MSELRPCPFCGGEAYLSDYECGRDGMPMNWRNPRCKRCGCDLGYAHHIEAVERWNRRAPEPYDKDAKIKELKEKVEELQDFIWEIQELQ